MIDVGAIKDAWMPIRDAAEFLGVSVQRMHQLIEAYELATDSINPRFKVVKRADVERLAGSDRPSGVRRDRRG